MNVPKVPKGGFNPPRPPAPPSGCGNASVTQNAGHGDTGSLGPLLNLNDLGIYHPDYYVQECMACQGSHARSATRPSVLSVAMAEATDEAREFLRQALAKTGLSPYALAKKAGVASTTITRPLNDLEFKFVPKKITLDKIADAAGLTPPKLSETPLTVELVGQWVPLVGEVRAGAWLEIPDEPIVEERIPVHLPEYQRANLFAVRVAGRSMDLKYTEGTIIIAIPPAEGGLRVGDDVIVRWKRGDLAETTLKEMVQEVDGSYALYPRSTDTSFEPIRLTRAEDSDNGPEIIGVVIYSIIPNRQGRGPLVMLD